jgi:hypothetical protein
MLRLSKRPPDLVIGEASNPYLKRWILIKPNRWFNVYLHRFCRSDDPRALHDHPRHSVSVILRGGYLDITQDADGKARPAILRRPGSINFRKASDAHRVQLLTGIDGREVRAWTLWIVGPHVREWGFHCPKGWRHWREFTAGERGEIIGKGCD